MKSKVLMVIGIGLIAQTTFASTIECIRTGIGGRSQKISVSRESVIKKGNFTIADDNFHNVRPSKYKFVDVYKAEKTAAILIAARFTDLATQSAEPSGPVGVDVKSEDYKRASRHHPWILIKPSLVPSIPVVQTIVNCPGIQISVNEKIGFDYKLFFRGDDMPWADYSTVELIENGQPSQAIFLSSLPDAAQVGARNMRGTFSKYYGVKKTIDLIFTVTDGQEMTEPKVLEPASEAYPRWHFYVEKVGYDNQFRSPTLEILK